MAKDNMHGYHPSSDLADATALAPADVAAAFAKVHTARLTLRRLRPRDGAAVFAVHSDPTTNRDTSAGSDPDRAASNARLRSWLRRWETDGYSIWVVTRLQARRVEEILGFGGVTRLLWRDREVLTLYYRFVPRAWDQDYATEVAQTAVELARAYLPHLPIIARTRPDNIAAQQTAERAGLRRHPGLDTAHIVFTLGWTPTIEPAERA